MREDTECISMNDSSDTMRELLYEQDGTALDNFSLSDIPEPNDRDEPVTVVARVQDRGSPLCSEGVYNVVQKHDYEPIAAQLDEPTEMSPDTLAEEYMPRRPRRRYAYPSLRGQYLTV